MAEEKTIEQRLTALEEAVRELQSRLPPPARNWLDKVIGPIGNVDKEAFEQAMEYGRQYRCADRPPDDDEADKQS
jgi:hypothetical protein